MAGFGMSNTDYYRSMTNSLGAGTGDYTNLSNEMIDARRSGGAFTSGSGARSSSGGYNLSGITGDFDQTMVPTLDEYTQEQQARAARANTMQSFDIAGNEAFRTGGAGGAARQAFSRAMGATEGQRAYDSSMFDTSRLNMQAIQANQGANLSAAQLRQNAYQFGSSQESDNDRFLLSLLGGFA